jgi:metallophosphoesterase (TIGR03768 family)
MTDIHITDKESPAQAVYYGYGWGMISGYSPAMLTTTQVLDAAVQTVNALNREKPFDFGIFLGDAINSGQHNELRWYIDVLDGRTIKPDSGVMDDPVPGPLNDYQDDYKAAGLDPAIPWYQVLGNHDHFWMGLFVPDDHIRSSLTGNAILNIGNVLTDKLRVNSRGFYVGAIDGRTPYGDITGAGPVSDFPRGPPTVPADPDRRFLSRTEWIGEFFNSSSAPAGHGFDRSDVTTGFACYSFDPRSDLPIRVIVLDDTQDDNNPVDGSSSGHGSLDKERYDWLVKELDKGQAEGRLMIIAAHIPVGVELESSGLGSLLTWDKYAAVSDTDLVSKLHTYPNLILWVSGHRHLNTVTALKSPDPSRPELGFWEVETASLREFPQQFRTFEIVQNSDNTISIFATDVDPSVSDGSPAAGSRSYAIAAYQTFRSGADSHPVGSYNAELVKQLSPEMQVKIQKYGTPAAAGSLRSSTLPGPAPRNPSPTAKSFAVSTTPTGSGDWKFVVFGDSPDPVANTTTGVSPNLSPIAKAIATEKPDLALYIGDLVNGADLTNASPMQNNFTGQFANWEQAVSPIHNYTVNTGIPLYVIRGNHEDGLDKTNAALLDAYRTIVASGMPANGPPGEEKLTYSFTHKGAKFILNDNYIAHNGKKETVNQSWVDGQLAQDTRPFMFVLGHSPAYLVDNDTEDIPFSLPTRPAERDTFWNSMVKSNVSAYFCGHAHLYVRAESQGLPQIVVGNGGAPMQGFDPALANPALTLNYPLKPIAQNDQQVGYLVITLHEDTRTFNGVQKVLNPVTGAWETGDTFTLRAR